MSIPTNTDTTLGVVFNAMLFSSVLYGVGCSQAWSYYRNHNKHDSCVLKGIVAFVLACDTVHVVLQAVSTYHYCVTRSGNPRALFWIEGPFFIQYFFSGGVVIGVQMFYCWRIHAFCSSINPETLRARTWLPASWIIAGVPALLAWTALGLLYTWTVKVMQYTFFGDLAKHAYLAALVNTLTVATDVSISVIMLYYLKRSETPFRRSRSIINRLILFTLNAALPSSLCALMALITLLIAPQTFLYMLFYIMICRFYTNSMFVMLNSREYIRDGGRQCRPMPVTHHEPPTLPRLRSTWVRNLEQSDDTKGSSMSMTRSIKPSEDAATVV